MAEGPKLAELRPNQTVEAKYLLLEKSLQMTKSGASYLALTLGDATGRIPGRVWEEAERFDALFGVGDVLRLRGRVVSYKGHNQINVVEVEPVGPGEVEASAFLPTARRPVKEMLRELEDMAGGLSSPLKELCLNLLTDEAFMTKFSAAPAAKAVHHVYLGGLVEHTLAVARLAEILAQRYPFLHRDLLICGAILHDVGKAEELHFTPAPDYTSSGRLLGHVVLGADLVRSHLPEGFPAPLAEEVIHLVLSHHGLLEFGSPKPPLTLEAVALNLLDDIDAKLNAVNAILDQSEEDWSEFSRLFERYFFKGSEARPETKKEPRPTKGRRRKEEDAPAKGELSLFKPD